MSQNEEIISDDNVNEEEYLIVPMFEEFSDQDMYPTVSNDLFGVIG